MRTISMRGGVFLLFLLLLSCSHDDLDKVIEPHEPQLLAVKFQMVDNPKQLIEDITCDIIGDSIVECWIEHLVSDKHLIPIFEYKGDSILIEQTEWSDGDVVDFKQPVRVKISSGNRTKEYTIYVHTYTGLPVLWIETEGRIDISSKEEYVDASFKLVEDVTTRAAGDIIEMKCQIKGRGNSSWDAPKKSYRIKLEKKASLLGEPSDKSWVLIANYYDKSMLRNQTAFFISKLSALDYTPRFHFVDLFFNGYYWGTYMLGDKLKISDNRVNVGKDGFLLEADERAERENAIFFRTERLPQPINIKDPDVEFGDENYNYVKDYFQNAENALYSDNFRDPEIGWQKYLDMTSFVDWYIIMELCKNYDAYPFYTSCYMNLKRDGKIKMGPVWDFDVTMGNSINLKVYSYTGIGLYKSKWYDRLLQDPAFVNKVKERFMFFYSKKETILENININAQWLKRSISENDYRWNIFYSKDYYNRDVWGSYYNEVQSLKTWLNNRFVWLKEDFETKN